MHQLLVFFQKNYAIFLFIILELIALYFLTSRNDYQKAKFLNSTSVVQTSIDEKQKKYQNYIHLEEVNQTLTQENSNLYATIDSLKHLLPVVDIDSLTIDSLTSANYTFQPARVISNFSKRTKSYITIDKGSNHGVKEQAGVILNNSIIGRVVLTDKNYSLVMPIFHLDSKINSKHLPSKYTGNLEWHGKNFETVQLNKIPRNAKITIGDTITTNQYSKSFPDGTLIGKVKSFELDYSKNFYQLEVEPFIEFSKLNLVYVVQRKDLEEIQEIEAQL